MLSSVLVGKMPRCQKCGTELDESARFCPACGTPVASQTTEPARSMRTKGNIVGEEILGIFPILIKKGWTPDAYDLVFTTERLIVAKRNRIGGRSPEYLVSYANARERLKMRDISAERVRAYLTADARNFELAYSDITVVETKPRGRYRMIDFDIYVGDLHAPKHEFSVAIRQQYSDDFLRFIQTVLPGKV